MASADIPTLARMLDWLDAAGASQVPHTSRVLKDHLLGTYRILASSGLPADVCRAGLFHSVYGTNAFKKVTVPANERARVRAVIGERAEFLAWTFGHLDRPRVLVDAAADDFKGVPCDSGLDSESVRDLALIECANLLEQGVLWRFPVLVRLARHVAMLTDDGFAPMKD